MCCSMYLLCCSRYFLCRSRYFLCCSMYCSFCVVLCIVCVYMCTVLLPPGGYPIAVKYIISYHIYSLCPGISKTRQIPGTRPIQSGYWLDSRLDVSDFDCDRLLEIRNQKPSIATVYIILLQHVSTSWKAIITQC